MKRHTQRDLSWVLIACAALASASCEFATKTAPGQTVATMDGSGVPAAVSGQSDAGSMSVVPREGAASTPNDGTADTAGRVADMPSAGAGGSASSVANAGASSPMSGSSADAGAAGSAAPVANSAGAGSSATGGPQAGAAAVDPSSTMAGSMGNTGAAGSAQGASGGSASGSGATGNGMAMTNAPPSAGANTAPAPASTATKSKPRLPNRMKAARMAALPNNAIRVAVTALVTFKIININIRLQRLVASGSPAFRWNQNIDDDGSLEECFGIYDQTGYSFVTCDGFDTQCDNNGAATAGTLYIETAPGGSVTVAGAGDDLCGSGRELLGCQYSPDANKESCGACAQLAGRDDLLCASEVELSCVDGLDCGLAVSCDAGYCEPDYGTGEPPESGGDEWTPESGGDDWTPESGGSGEWSEF